MLLLPPKETALDGTHDVALPHTMAATTLTALRQASLYRLNY